MDLGINTIVDLDCPFDELLPAISAAGFSFVSLSHRVGHAGYHLPERRRAIAGAMRELGLKLNYIHVPIDYYHDLSSTDEQVRRATIETYKMSINACAELAGRSVVAHATARLDIAEIDMPQAVELSLASTAELCRHADERGVTFCLENLPLTWSAQQVSLRVMEAADFAGFGLCLDTCHATIANEDPLALVRWMAPRVRATHLSDTQGQHDSHLIPGQGAVDFAAVAHELGRSGFSGVVDLECSLSMLRGRHASNKLHPGDLALCTTAEYLKQSADAARWIAGELQPTAAG